MQPARPCTLDRRRWYRDARLSGGFSSWRPSWVNFGCCWRVDWVAVQPALLTIC
jgi:hypothetical protein